MTPVGQSGMVIVGSQQDDYWGGPARGQQAGPCELQCFTDKIGKVWNKKKKKSALKKVTPRF